MVVPFADGYEPGCAVGFPTKATWIKATRKGNYQSCPLVNSKNVNNFFPESEETQKGHMCGKRQGKHSTKEKATTPEVAATQKSTKQKNSGVYTQQEHLHVPFDNKTIFLLQSTNHGTPYTRIKPESSRTPLAEAITTRW